MNGIEHTPAEVAAKQLPSGRSRSIALGCVLTMCLYGDASARAAGDGEGSGTNGASAARWPCHPSRPLAELAARVVSQKVGAGNKLLTMARSVGAPERGLRLYRSTNVHAIRRSLQGLRQSMPLQCGMVSTGETTTAVVAADYVRLKMLPRGAVQLTLHAELRPGKPTLLVTAPDGVTLARPLRQVSRGIYRSMPGALQQTQMVQVVVDYPDNPQVLLQQSVAAVTARSRGLRWGRCKDSGCLYNDLNDWRRERGITSTLRFNQLLSRVAEQYGEKVCQQRRLVHRLRPHRNPERRVQDAGLRARLVGEVLARGESSMDAFFALQMSPAHRAVLLDRRYTDVGVSEVAAEERRGACIVMVLAAWPQPAPATAR